MRRHTAPRADVRTHRGAGVSVFFRPRWLAVHLVVWAAAVAMVLLGRWQLDVSNAKHFDLQNFGYTLQWWAFAASALFFWVRLMRDTRRTDTAGQSTGNQLVLRRGPAGGAVEPSYTGPADLLVAGSHPGDDAVSYRGYVLPNSAVNPVRSHGDQHHDSYNDYLWQLAMADAANGPGARRAAGEDQRGNPDDERGTPIDERSNANDELKTIDAATHGRPASAPVDDPASPFSSPQS